MGVGRGGAGGDGAGEEEGEQEPGDEGRAAAAGAAAAAGLGGAAASASSEAPPSWWWGPGDALRGEASGDALPSLPALAGVAPIFHAPARLSVDGDGGMNAALASMVRV
jgi:hypothetical protein